MRTAIDLFKSLLVGGLVFLLPFGVILVVFGKLLAISQQVGAGLHDTLFPGTESRALLLAFAILILVLIALAAGAFARTRAGLALFEWLERTVLSRLPIYTILRQTIADMSGGVEVLGSEGEERVVAVHFDDQTQIGFVVDRAAPDGRIVVYLPGAPSAMSGTVAIVEAARVEETDLKAQQVMMGMRRLGAGLVAVMDQTRHKPG